MYDYGARWYDASLGRFTSPDSIVPLASQGVQAWDGYAFVSNNPLKYIDPTGHIAVRSMSFGEEPPPPHKPTATPRPSPASPQDIFKGQQTPTPQGPVFQPGPTSKATPANPYSSPQTNWEFPYQVTVDTSKIDPVDFWIDIVGIIGEPAAVLGVVPYAITEVAEGAGLVKDFYDTAVEYDTTGLSLDIFVHTLGEVVPDAVRLAPPGVGFWGNIASLILNVGPSVSVNPRK